METVVFTVLFAFPGALVDIFFSLLAPERYKEKKQNDTMRLAKYFLVSAFIASISLIPFYDVSDNGIIEVYKHIINSWDIGLYITISVTVSFLIAYIQKVVFSIPQKTKESRYILPEKSVWDTMTKNTDWMNVYCVLVKDNKVIRCGRFDSIFPIDWEDDKAIALRWSDWMTEWFSNENLPAEERGHLVVEYFSFDIGYSIRFYKSDYLNNYLSKKS